MLGKLCPAFDKNIPAVYDSVHHDELGLTHMADFIPGERTVLGERAFKSHDGLLVGVFPVENVICKEQIDFRTLLLKVFKYSDYLKKDFGISPVIRVYVLEKDSRCFLNACIDGSAVACVLLMDGADYSGILIFVSLRDLKSIILGRSVINDEDLNIVSARKQRLNARLHVRRGIITRNRNR